MLTAKYYFYSMKTKLYDPLTQKLEEVDMKKYNWGVSEAARYKLSDKIMVKASATYEVRLPTETELIGDGFLLRPSGDLLPERGTNLNLGLMYDNVKNNSLLQVEINAFYSYLTDMIRYTRDIIQGKYVNFGEMRSLGVEAEVKADITNWLYGYANTTFQDLRDTRDFEPNSVLPNPTKGLRMPNIPYFMANAGLEFHKANLLGGKEQNTRIFTDASFIEEYFYDFEQSIHQERRIPRSFKIDLGLEQTFMNGKVTFSAKVNNVLGAKLLSEFGYPLSRTNIWRSHQIHFQINKFQQTIILVTYQNEKTNQKNGAAPFGDFVSIRRLRKKQSIAC